MQRPAGFRVRDGAEFDHLLPKSSGEDRTISRDADLGLTLEVLPGVVGDYHWQTKKLARRLQGTTRRECASNIWEFCFWYFAYQPDAEGTEQIRTPARSWADRHRGIDCDCFCVIVSSLLKNMRDPPTGRTGIPHALRVTRYVKDGMAEGKFSHIYVVVPDRGGELVIDPVLDRFNYEVPYIENIDLDMKLQVLNGPPSIDQLDLGLGRGPKWERLHQEAADSGKSVEELIERNKRAFEAKTGKSPEQFHREQQEKIRSIHQQSRQLEEQAIAKLKAELTARGEPFADDATREQLLDLIRASTHASAQTGAINRLNKNNPVAVKLRRGLTDGLAKNALNVAAKLSYGLMSRQRAIAAGVSGEGYDKIKKGWTKIKEIYFHAGGTASELVAAIRQGTGQQPSSLAGLGAIDAGAKMLSGSAAIALVAGLLKSVKVPQPQQTRQPGGSVPVRFSPESNPSAELITVTAGEEGASIQLPSGPPPQRKKKWLKWVIGGGILAALGGGGYALHRSRKARTEAEAKPKPKTSKANGGLNGPRKPTTAKRKPVRRIPIK